VREAGEDRLSRLEDEPHDDVLDGDGLDLVPQVREPARDVDAEQLEDQDNDRDAHEPRADLRQPPSARLATRSGSLTDPTDRIAHPSEPRPLLDRNPLAASAAA